jgi:hypothetical protein
VTYLYVEMDVNQFYTRLPDPNDSWDAGEQEAQLEYLGLSLADWSLDARTWRSKVRTKDVFERGDHAYVVVVRYTTGCTFGFQTKLPMVVDIFKESHQAENLCDCIMAAYKNDAYTFVYDEKEYYAGAWTGYFESIDDIEIREVLVK